MARAKGFDPYGNPIDPLEEVRIDQEQQQEAQPTPQRRRLLIPGESGAEENDWYWEGDPVPKPQAQPTPARVATPPPQTPALAPVIDPQKGIGRVSIDDILSRFQPPRQEVPSELLQLMQQNDARRRSFEDTVRQQVLGLLQAGQRPIDADTSPEARAFRRISERQLAMNRAQQAEQRAARGVGAVGGGEVSGALESDIATGQSQLAERLQAFESQLVSQQLRERRQQLMDALRLGAGILSRDQSDALQRELATIDAQLRRELGFADIGLRGFLGGGQLSLGLIQTLLNNQLGYDRLGFDIGALEAGLNADAVRGARS